MRRFQQQKNTEQLKPPFEVACNPPKLKRKRPSPITLRLTDEEREKLIIAAGDMPVSAYIRKCVFGAEVAPRKKRLSHKPVADQKAIARILSLLGQTRIANNLNQIAYQANCGTLLLDVDTKWQIKETCAYIAFMRVKLIEALGLKEEH